MRFADDARTFQHFLATRLGCGAGAVPFVLVEDCLTVMEDWIMCQRTPDHFVPLDLSEREKGLVVAIVLANERNRKGDAEHHEKARPI